MAKCKHSIADVSLACSRGACPLCLQAEVERLKEDFLIYGMHLVDCPCYIPEGDWDTNDHHTKTPDELNVEKRGKVFFTTVKCTCGYDQALKGR